MKNHTTTTTTTITQSTTNEQQHQQQQWIVFTAGAMGSGKSHTIRVLAAHHRFPLHAFVYVDPDQLRHRLPEFPTYLHEHPDRAGEWTRQETGLLAEVLVRAALDRHHHVLVDGSLRDADWYERYFATLREQYQEQGLSIAILHVVAPRETVLERAEVSESYYGVVCCVVLYGGTWLLLLSLSTPSLSCSPPPRTLTCFAHATPVTTVPRQDHGPRRTPTLVGIESGTGTTVGRALGTVR